MGLDQISEPVGVQLVEIVRSLDQVDRSWIDVRQDAATIVARCAADRYT